MAKQVAERRGTRRGQRALMVPLTPELAADVVQLLGAIVQCLFDHDVINQMDVANLAAQNPPHSTRRST